MKVLCRVFFSGLVFLVFPILVYTQSNAKLGPRIGDNWMVGASFGPTFFSGDLNEKRLWPASGDFRMGGTLYAGRQMNQIFTLRGQFLFGKTAGTKDSLHFDATLLEGNANTLINLSNLIGGYNARRLFFVYATFGLGITGWTTTVTDNKNGTLIPNPASGWKAAGVFPLGLGGYFSINNKINIGLEYTLRPTTSDLVDGKKGGFVIDMYSYLALGITVNFNKGTRKQPDVVDIKRDGPLLVNLPKCDPVPVPKGPADPVQRMDKLPSLPPSPVSGPLPDANYKYKVQIFAFSQRIYSSESIRKRYKIPVPVNREYSDGLYRYTVGSTDNLQEARELRDRMISNGIRDAFIVAYSQDGKRMPFMQSLQQ